MKLKYAIILAVVALAAGLFGPSIYRMIVDDTDCSMTSPHYGERGYVWPDGMCHHLKRSSILTPSRSYSPIIRPPRRIMPRMTPEVKRYDI